MNPETEVAMLMNTRQTGGALTPVPVAVDKNTYNIWGEMAANMAMQINSKCFQTSA